MIGVVYLVRKIDRKKWEPNPGLQQNEISADAVTANLKTTENKLSLWKCEVAEPKELEQIALALGAAGERIDKIDIVWVAKEILDKDGIKLVESSGTTPVAELRSRHMDAVLLDLSRIGKVAHCLADAIRIGEQHYRFSYNQVKELVCTAVQQGLVTASDLSERIRSEVQNEIVGLARRR